MRVYIESPPRKSLLPARKPESPLAPADGPASEPADGVVRELLRFLRRNPGKILCATAVGAALSLAYTLPQVPVHQSTATLEIQDLNENFLNMKDLLPISSGAPQSAPSDVQTQLRILRSTTLIQRVLDKMPPERTGAATRLDKILGRTPQLQPAPPADREALIERVERNLQVREM